MGKLDVGGQAVLEGVMMRGPRSMVIAVRRPDQTIVVKDGQWVPLTERMKFLRWPFLRGSVVMVEALVNGMQALSFSADVQVQAEAEASGAEKAPSAALTSGAIAISLLSSLLFGAALFIYLPHLLASAVFALAAGVPISGLLAYEPPVELPWFHLLVGAIKMTLFIGYILAIRRMPDIRRVFQYHGAEHKSIHVYEAGEDLTVANARKWPTFHPRCGTSFAVFVILISIGFFAGIFPVLKAAVIPPELTGWKLTLLQASIKLPLMLPIAGLSYEAIRWAGRQRGQAITRILSIPGRWMQRLTTIEPDDGQLEVALVSLRRALEREGDLVDVDWSGVRFVQETAAARSAEPVAEAALPALSPEPA